MRDTQEERRPRKPQSQVMSLRARQCLAHLATSDEIDGQTKRCFIKCTDRRMPGWDKKPMAVAQIPQLGEVHLLWHNQRRPHEEQAGQKVKDEQEVQHQQELFTSEML
ncbi:hypothetical protein TNCV_2282581 [Trichonephila clavipes]|nr:hypothetical protein TNCV_2282581 [Trichonephila clavipes]